MRGQNVKKVVSVRVYFKIAPRHLFCIAVTKIGKACKALYRFFFFIAVIQ